MITIEIGTLPVIERLPGWRGRYFDSSNMTFAHYEFEAGASIHTHSHAQEEVYQIIEGELELTVDGIARHLGPGFAAIIPSDAIHSVKAISRGKVIIVDYPRREMPSHSAANPAHETERNS